MTAPARKPWPLRWIVASILLFIVPYTYVNIKYRKPDKAFEPYADMKEQANVKRLTDAGYHRATVRAERPFPALPARDLLPAGAAPARPAAAPGGLPAPLDTTLVEIPRLPAAYADLVAPASVAAEADARLQFTARLDGDHEHLGGAQVFVRENTIVVVPTFESVPGELRARSRESAVLLTLPGRFLKPGDYEVTLAGARDSLRWSLQVR